MKKLADFTLESNRHLPDLPQVGKTDMECGIRFNFFEYLPTLIDEASCLRCEPRNRHQMKKSGSACLLVAPSRCVSLSRFLSLLREVEWRT
jgi:hypothetical protein